ncbi:type II secretion system protein GspC [Desulfuromonas sp. AOP6]|uniref:type II secretion system protein GspC n=1 Tax=Desulfuromonas sp. AOP6 TaxID=1566351 RepID=UPI0012857319|nr:type II secretion system protein GspC [Desulfuromonas sp. AOP6]BCA80375.1 hypothetical protein AOP6_2162 [Desulfuromonas sp. AOP6]
MFVILQRYYREFLLLLVALLGLSLGKLAADGVGVFVSPPVITAKSAAPPAPARERQATLSDYETILVRNIFDASGSSRVVTFQNTTRATAPSESTPATRGSLTLIGTVARGPESLALIQANNKIETFRLDDSLPGNGRLEEITRDAVTIRYPDGSREILLIHQDGHKAQTAPVTAPSANGRAASNGYQVRDLGNNKWAIPKEQAERARQNIGELLQQARMEPRLIDGKTAGFAVKMIRPNSILAQMGLQLGDVVIEVNGVTLDSPEKALQIFQQLREAKSIVVGLERNGQPMNFAYEVN